MPEVTFTIETREPDANGDIILPSAYSDLPKKVPVVVDFGGKPICECESFIEGGLLKGKANIDESKLDFYPTIGFQYKTLKQLKNGTRLITDLKLLCVSLSRSIVDSNIKSIREQIQHNSEK